MKKCNETNQKKSATRSILVDKGGCTCVTNRGTPKNMPNHGDKPYQLWLRISTSISFKDAFFLTYQSLIALVLVVTIAFRIALLLPELCTFLLSKRNKKLKQHKFCKFLIHFHNALVTVTGILMTACFVGIVLVTVLFSELPAWLGTLLVGSILMLAWLHCNRSKIVPTKTEERQKQEQVFKEQVDGMFKVKLLDPDLSTYYEENERQKKPLYKKVSHALKQYTNDIYSGVRKRALLFIFGLLIIAIFSPFVAFLSCDICIETHPIRMSTYLTRLIFADRVETCSMFKFTHREISSYLLFKCI